MKTPFCNNLFLCAATLALGILCDTNAHAQGGVPVWTNRYNGPGNGDDVAHAIAVDGSGNVFVAGYSWGSGSDWDYATIKYSGAGVALWTNRYNGPANSDDLVSAMAVDGSGNVIVTGHSWGSDYDYATVKYSGAGVALWTNRYDGPANKDDEANAVAVDGSGNVFVTGYSYSYAFGINVDYATIAYSGAGVALWTNRYDGPEHFDEYPNAVAVDGSGNVFVTGQRSAGGSGYDYATIAYSRAVAALWTNPYNGPGNGFDGAKAMAVDGSGNVFVTGISYGIGFVNPDYATIAYSGAGVALWTNRYNGPGNGADEAHAVAVDGSGNVFVTGFSAIDNSGVGSSYDYATIAYSSTGIPLWTNRYNGPGNSADDARAVAVDGSGNVFVTGSSTGTNGLSDYATIKYSSAIPPSLTVALTTTNTLALTWPSPSTGFTLQQNTNGLATANWSNVVTTPSDDGNTRTVIVDPPAGNRFYRLIHP